METPQKLMTAKNLYLELGTKSRKVKILNDINLEINQGEKIAIVGPSGSGKTSLMMILAGLMLPTTGKIYFKDQLLNQMNEDQLALFRQHHIGIVFQNFHLIPSLSAIQNIAFPLALAGRNDATEQALKWLKRVGLEKRADHMPSQLSGGEQQRVALARALIMQPSIILADEPTGNLDTENGDMITKLMFEMVEQNNAALILITHDEKLAERTNRIIQLVDGRIVSPQNSVSIKNKKAEKQKR